jgi:transcriptional regulator with XRE-family HTH domain
MIAMITAARKPKRKRRMDAKAEHPLTADTRAKLRGEEMTGFLMHVARKSGVSRSWITQFMRGDVRNPRVDTLQRVSDACDEVLRLVTLLRS